MKVSVVVVALLVFVSCSSRLYTSSDGGLNGNAAVHFSDNSGESFNEAIVVYGINSSKEAIDAEYKYISDRHGIRGQDWFLLGQTIVAEKSKVVDVVEFRLSTPADRRVIFFDAGNFIK